MHTGEKFNLYLLTIGIATAILMSAASGMAQEPVVRLSADTTEIPLGGQTTLELRVEYSGNLDFYWPAFSDTIYGRIEIVKQTSVDTLFDKKTNVTSLLQRIIITCFDSGYYVIPPVKVLYRIPGQTEYSVVESNPLLLTVRGVEVDPDQPIRDIKELMPAPVTIGELLPFVLVALLLGLAGLGLYFRKHKQLAKAMPVAVRRPKVPPHRIALDELDSLRQKRLWQNGKVKEYHSELTDILRKYLQSRFGFDAPEMTTSEILSEIMRYESNGDLRSKLQEILERADLVKFAKNQPLPDEHDRSLELSVDFVKKTIPQPVLVSVSETSQSNVSNRQEGREE